MAYLSLGEMPQETADAFVYLVDQYGRSKLNPVTDQHEAALAAIAAEMERAHAAR